MEEERGAEELGRALPPRERQFVREYLKDLNGTAAAVRTPFLLQGIRPHSTA